MTNTARRCNAGGRGFPGTAAEAYSHAKTYCRECGKKVRITSFKLDKQGWPTIVLAHHNAKEKVYSVPQVTTL